MKKIVKRIILLFIVILLLQLISYIFKKEHDINYELNYNDQNYKIHEIYKDDRYNFEINIDNNYFVLDTDNLYHKKKKVIDKIYYYDTEDIKCIYTPLENTDIICLENSTLKSYYEASKHIKSFVKELKQLGYTNPSWNIKDSKVKTIDQVEVYQDNISDNTYIYLYKYNGFFKITNKYLSKINTFSNDTYLNTLGIQTDKYYVIPNYDDKHDFKEIYVYNMKNDKKKTIKLKNKISTDSYINGVVDGKIYLTDKDNLIQYRIDPKKRKVEEVGNTNDGGLTYQNNEFKSINMYEFRKTEIKYEQDYTDIISDYQYINKVNNNYYYLKNDTFYKYNSTFGVTQVLFKSEASNIVMNNENIYFVKDNKLYLYDGYLREILKYDELSFNSTNRYAVYKKS